MRGTAGWWLVKHVWRLALLVGGGVLLAWALSNATHGLTSWWVFGLGAAAGTCIAGVALFWPWRSGRLRPEPSRPAQEDAVGTQVFVVAVAIALVVVIGLVGHYGAAVGAFSVITGIWVLESFRRQWRQTREIELRRRGRPPER